MQISRNDKVPVRLSRCVLSFLVSCLVWRSHCRGDDCRAEIAYWVKTCPLSGSNFRSIAKMSLGSYETCACESRYQILDR